MGNRSETLKVGRYEIERDELHYTIKSRTKEHRFSRFHAAIAALSTEIPIFYFKGDYGERLLDARAMPRPDANLSPLDIDVKLPYPLTWGSAVAGSATGMIFEAMLNDTFVRDKVARADLEELLVDCGIEIDDELRRAMDRYSPVKMFTSAVRRYFRDIPRPQRGQKVSEYAAEVGRKTAIQIGSVESNYMRRAGDVGTQIHAILEFVSIHCMTVKDTEWPTNEVQFEFSSVNQDYIDRAELTWRATVSQLGFTGADILAVEPVIILNHQSEGIAGAADLIVLINGQVVIVDWKTSRKVASRSDFVIQVATYSLASSILTHDGVAKLTHFDISRSDEIKESNERLHQFVLNGEMEAAKEEALYLEDLKNEGDTDVVSVINMPDGNEYPMADYSIVVQVESLLNDTSLYKIDVSGDVRRFVIRLLRANSACSQGFLTKRMRKVRKSGTQARV
jgi:hypothetical protein